MVPPIYEYGDLIRDRYYILKKELDGSYSEIYHIIDKQKPRGSLYILKVIPESSFREDSSHQEQLEKEKRIHQLLSPHPLILSCHDCFYHDSNFCLITHYMAAGDLFDSNLPPAKPEKLLQKYFRQITRAVQYCHQCNILHRDLKLENILLNPVTDQIQLADFGSATDKLESSSVLGTIYYFSPERLQKLSYSTPADIWSLGIILYELLHLKYPYDERDKDSQILLKHILSHSPVTHPPKSRRSKLSKSLVDLILTLDPEDRPTSYEILEHTWLN